MYIYRSISAVISKTQRFTVTGPFPDFYCSIYCVMVIFMQLLRAAILDALTENKQHRMSIPGNK